MGKYDLTDNVTTEQAAVASGARDNVIARSFRGGVYGAGSQLADLGGLVAENLDAPEQATSLRAMSAQLQGQAALPQNSSGVSSFKQLRDAPSLRNAGEYLGGLVGGSLPYVGAGIAGGLATGGAGYVPAALGAAAALTPFEAGDVAQRQLADPTAMQATPGDRLRDAVVGGGASALAQSIVPGAVAGKIAGRGAGVLRSNLSAIPIEGVSEGAGEAIKQVGVSRDKPLDWEAVGENAIGGAAAGGAFAGAGAAADAVRGAAPGAARGVADLAGRAKDRLTPKNVATDAPAAATEPDTAAPKAFGSIWDDLRDLGQKGKTKVDDTVDRVMSGQPLGDLKEFATAQGDRLNEMTAASAAETAKKVQEWGGEMLNDAGLTPERRAAVSEAMQAGNARVVAEMKKAWDKGKAVVGKVDKFYEAFKRRDVDVKATDVSNRIEGPKKSEDYSGAVRAIVADIVPMLQASQPELVSDGDSMTKLGQGLRQTIEDMSKGPLSSDRIAMMIDILGPDTSNVLIKLNERFGANDANPDQTESFFKQISDIERTQELHEKIRTALTPEAQETTLTSDIPDMALKLVAMARGETVKAGSAQEKVLNKQLRDFMQSHFGANADAISKAIEKEAGLGKTERAKVQEGEFDDNGEPIKAEELDVIKKGRGKKHEPVMHPDLFKANNEQGQNYGAQYQLDMANKYPDRTIGFEYAEGSTTHGYITAEKAANPEALSEADVEGMKLDTKKYANSKDRIEVGDNILDTRRIARTMEKRLPYTTYDEQSSAHRLSRMFTEGLARLTEQHGNIKVPDTAVIGTFGDADFTFGDAKALRSKMTKADKETMADMAMLSDLRADYKNAKTDGARKALADKAKEITDRRDAALAKDLAGERIDDAVDESKRDAPKDDQIPRAAADNKPDDLIVRSNMDGSARHTSDKRDLLEGKMRNLMGMAIEKWGKVESAGAKTVAKHAAVLLKKIHTMGRADRRAFLELNSVSVGDAAPVVSALRTKYRDAIVAPANAVVRPAKPADKGKVPALADRPKAPEITAHDKRQQELEQAFEAGDWERIGRYARTGDAPLGKDLTDAIQRVLDRKKEAPIATTARVNKLLDWFNEPPESYTTEKARGYVKWAKEQVKVVQADLDAETDQNSDNWDRLDDLVSRLKIMLDKAAKVIDGDESLKDVEGTPGPKAVAAKKAAFLERARSGDKTLIAELKASTDAKGLQRAVSAAVDEYANNVDPYGGLRKTIDTINKRLSQLLKDEDVAYGLQTKKYSLARTGYETSHPSGGEIGRTRSSFAKDVGPVKDAQLFTYRNFDGDEVTLRLIDRDIRGVDGTVAEFGIYQNREGKWEIYTDGPTPGTKAFEKYRHLFDTFTAGDTNPYGVEIDQEDGHGYSKFRDGVFSGATTRKLFRTLRDHAAELGVSPDEVVFGRETGVNAGSPYRSLNRERIAAFSAQTTNPNVNNAASPRQDIKDYINRVLGPSVRTAWAQFSHAGEFARTNTGDVIRLSVHALNPMSVAYHESLHGFFAKLGDMGAKDVAAVLERTAQSAHVLRQMTEFFKNEPAVLQQLRDPEERAAYMYQMWANGDLQVGAQAKTIFQRIAQFIRDMLGVWSNDQRALHIMEYFNRGDFVANMHNPNAVRRVLMEPGRNKSLETARELTAPFARLADAVFSTGSARLRETGVPALQDLADLIKRDDTAEGGDQGFIPAARVAATKLRTELATALEPYSPETLDQAMEALQRGVTALAPEARLAQRAIKKSLANTKAYMEGAGVELGDLGPDYFPRVWDVHYISKNQQAFKDMLEPYIRSGEFKGTADGFLRNLMSREGNEFGIETRSPGMQFKKTRELAFLKPADVAEFVTKDLYGTLTSYANQAARKAEWQRRLGEDRLSSLFERAKAEGATDQQIELADEYLRGVDGTLGDTINPHARRIMGNMIVYQNIRLLPLAAFSSIVDPLGVMVRGGTVSDAWTTLKRGVKEIPQSYKKTPAGNDAAADLAELVGVIDSAVLNHTMGDLYTQGMVGGAAKKINSAFFKYNLMEGMNRSFRVGASEAAMRFMLRNANSVEGHSKRWMQELGLRTGDIVQVGDRIAVTEAEGLTAEQVVRVHAAINQWVDGAVLRPDAADKPIWMNDPHWALIAHLKQFVYSFQKVILGRVVHEFEQGNYAPVLALTSYVPVMIAADLVKGIIQGGGDEPEWKKGWTAADYVGRGIERAGLYGVGQFGMDVASDVERGGSGAFALLGPTVEQLGDAVQVLGGSKQFAPVLLRSMPANALYKDSLAKAGEEG